MAHQAVFNSTVGIKSKMCSPINVSQPRKMFLFYSFRPLFAAQNQSLENNFPWSKKYIFEVVVHHQILYNLAVNS